MAYGSPNATPATSHWWTANVVIPCQSSGGMNLVARLEGSQTMPAYQSSSSKRGSSSRASGDSAKRRVCGAWNQGGCQNKCPNDEIHQCMTCGKGHRQTECSRSGKNTGKNNGNGKGHNNKKKGNNKGGKGSKGSKGKSPM